MSRKKLTIQEQINVLKDAKKILQTGSFSGMCVCIEQSLRKYDIKTSWYINCYIPTFTLNHICKLTKNTELYPKCLNKYWFWWNFGEIDIRSEVFDLLIKELEEKLTK